MRLRRDDLVGRGRAVQDEIGLLRPEDVGCLLLRLKRRPLVGQQVAELEDGIVEIVAEHRLAEMLHEDPPDRASRIEDAAVVAGAGPELVALLGVVDERAEERRLQRLGVLLEARDEILGDELGRLLGEEHVAVDEVEHLDRNVLEALAAHENDDRHVETASAHEVDERGRLPLDALLAPVDHEQSDRGVGLDGDLRILDPARLDHLKAHALDRRDDLVDPQALEVVRVEHRRGEQERETLEEVHSVWAQGWRTAGRGAERVPWPMAELRQDGGGGIKAPPARPRPERGRDRFWSPAPMGPPAPKTASTSPNRHAERLAWQTAPIGVASGHADASRR